MTTYSIALDLERSSSLDTREMLIREVRRGMFGRPRSLPPWMFYDARGSRLFEYITQLPEYYPTRAERNILASCCDDIVAAACPDKSGAVRLVELGAGTAANEADINQMAAVLHGSEEAVFADAGYSGADKRPELADRDVSWNIAIKRSIIKALPKGLRDWAEAVERALSQVRAWVEHPFHVIKNLFRHKKLRYRGLAKNTAQLHTLFALANLVIVKKALLAPARA